MIALDTNAILRLVTDDDADQRRAVLRLLRNKRRVFVAKTVLLEAAWVLGSTFERSNDQVADILRRMLGYPAFVFEDRYVIESALSMTDSGLDFADALHLASSHPAATFHTFDRALARRATEARTRPKVEDIAKR